MSLIDELSKLEEMHRRGTLSESEFALAKQQLLANPGTAPLENNSNIENHLSEQLNEIRFQNDVAALDREWEIESKHYLLRDRNGYAQYPTQSMGWSVMLIGVPFGIFWTIMAYAITSGAPDEGPFKIAKIFFPAFGLIFVAAAIGLSFYIQKRAKQYQEAYQRYRRRRKELLGEADDLSEPMN